MKSEILKVVSICLSTLLCMSGTIYVSGTSVNAISSANEVYIYDLNEYTKDSTVVKIANDWELSWQDFDFVEYRKGDYTLSVYSSVLQRKVDLLSREHNMVTYATEDYEASILEYCIRAGMYKYYIHVSSTESYFVLQNSQGTKIHTDELMECISSFVM